MESFRQQYRETFLSVGGDIPGRLASQSSLNNSTAIYHDQVITMGFLPQIFSATELSYFNEIADTTYTILEAITQRYCTDADYRKLFAFSPLLEYLILLPTGYESTIPITRIDIFIDLESKAFKFCEFNTDGSSAMNEDREVCNAIALSETFVQMSEQVALRPQELFDPWVEAFCSIYEQSTHATARTAHEDKTVAIVDYADKTTIFELREFRKRFERAGLRCLICDVHDLIYRDGILYGTDMDADLDNSFSADKVPVRLDAIYRRAVTSDIIEDLTHEASQNQKSIITPEELATIQDTQGTTALLAATRDCAVCLIGGFKTQVAHSKTIFTMLHHPETLSFMDEEQRLFIQEHVPYTVRLSSESIHTLEVAGNKDRWIIKPIDGYASQGVHAGKSYSTSDWEKLLSECSAKGYVLQEYCEQYSMPNTLPVPFDDQGKPLFNSLETASHCIHEGSFDPLDLEPYNLLTGLFVYDGVFQGVYMRAGTDSLIVGFRGGITLGTFIADDMTEF